MQSQEKEYEHNVWGIYRKEWETASPERKRQLNKRMLRWQELIKSGLTASQAYNRAIQEESDRPPIYTMIQEELGSRVTGKPSGKQLAISSTPQIRRAPLILLGLTLVAAIIYSVVITGDRNSLNTDLESVQSILVSTQGELSSTKQTLASVQSELGTTKAELETANAKLKLYKDTLGIEVFPDMRDKIVKGGSLFPREYVNLTDNPDAMNPTWSKLIAFLRAKPTDDEYYNAQNYNCTNFAERLHNDAEAAGIKAAFVAVSFIDSEEGHALNAFTTTDKGLVYVDCTGYDILEISFDEWIYTKIHPTAYYSIASALKGEEYCRWSIDEYTFQDYRYYKPYRQTSDWKSYGIVESIRIYW